MSIEEFLQKVAYPGVQPFPSGGGEASATQEDDILKASEPTPLEPFIF